MIALVRTEFTKATRRLRTLVIALLLVGLPTLIVVAIHTHPARGRGDANEGEGLFRLARLSGLLVPAAVLSAMSGFLLIVIAGMFAGDSVASDASWGNLRYVLMRPVGRARLLLAKTFVAGTLIWTATIVVVLAGLAGGIVLFGSHPLTLPVSVDPAAGTLGTGFTISTTMLAARLGIATAYVAFGYTGLLAMGTFFSTLTDTPAGAIGASIGVYIVSEILDSISQLGRLRYVLPTHYLQSWTSMFTADRYSHDMIAGIAVQVLYLLVFGAAALAWFGRKDIQS